MESSSSADVELLWKRVGLKELRSALSQVDELARHFEATLRTLPPCDQCARAVLFEQIQKTGSRLSGKVTTLSALAGTLEDAAKATEKARRDLEKNCPLPCQCKEGACACHE